jgi:RHS repeat-associated protein
VLPFGEYAGDFSSESKGLPYLDWETWEMVDPNAGNVGYNDGIVTAADIKQINPFYPFGLNMEGNWNGAAGNNKYQYNEKEWNDDFGLGLNDYGARFYDPATARWTAVDPLAEMYLNLALYNYVANNPIKYTDPNGMCIGPCRPAAISDDTRFLPIFNQLISSLRGDDPIQGKEGNFTISSRTVYNGLPGHPNHQGVEMKMTYTPKKKVDRSSLGFVQIIMSGQLNDTDEQYYRSTENLWRVDRGDNQCFGFYGMSNQRGYSDNYYFNSAGDPVFWDAPGTDVNVTPLKDGITLFEVYVVDIKTGVVGDGISWGYQVSNSALKPKITLLPVNGLSIMSRNFKAAIPMWNAQVGLPSKDLQSCEQLQRYLKLKLD